MCAPAVRSRPAPTRKKAEADAGLHTKGTRASWADSARTPARPGLQRSPRTAEIRPGPPAAGHAEWGRHLLPHGSSYPSPLHKSPGRWKASGGGVARAQVTPSAAESGGGKLGQLGAGPGSGARRGRSRPPPAPACLSTPGTQATPRAAAA